VRANLDETIINIIKLNKGKFADEEVLREDTFRVRPSLSDEDT